MQYNIDFTILLREKIPVVFFLVIFDYFCLEEIINEKFLFNFFFKLSGNQNLLSSATKITVYNII